MYDASSRKDVRRAEKAARQAEVARLDYLKAAMSTWQGRAWFHGLLEFCHLFNDPFTNDALREAYSKGERNVGLRLFADIVAHCPDDYILMMREENARRAQRESAANRADDSLDPSAAERPGSAVSGRDVEGCADDYDPYTEPDAD